MSTITLATAAAFPTWPGEKRHNRRMDIGAIRDLVVGIGGGGAALWLGKLIMQRIGSGERAGTAGNEALLAIIKQQEATIARLQDRDVASTERADKAERERNEALMQITHLTFTVQTLRDEVQKLRTEVERANAAK